MKYFILLTSLLMMGCESTKDVKDSSINEGEFSETISRVIDETELLEENLSLDIVLRSATSRQKISLRAILSEIKTALFILNERPSDKRALKNLFNMQTQLKNIPMQRRDEEFFTTYIEGLDLLILKISKYQSQEISELRWLLWSENFDRGLGKFLSFGEKGKWTVGNFNRKGHMEAKSSVSKQWLISPLIDLKQVVNPGLRLTHLVHLKASSDSGRRVNKELIKILISTNYEFGSPEKANWTPLPMQDVPVISDFNALPSEILNLDSYQGKKISIAFVLDKTADNRKVVWQIQNIEILGASSEPNIISERIDPTIYLFQHNFMDGMGPFKQENSGENPPEFKITTRNDESYIQADTFRDKKSGVVYLTSTPFAISETSNSIQIKQAINFYKQPAKDEEFIQIFIKYDEGEWQSLNFTQVPLGNNYTPVISEWLKLHLDAGATAQLRFRYECGTEVKEYPNWSIYSVSVRQDD